MHGLIWIRKARLTLLTANWLDLFLRESYCVHATLNADESCADVSFGFVFCHMQAEHELRVAQREFDRQAEVTGLLLEGISSTHVSRLYMHAALEA